MKWREDILKKKIPARTKLRGEATESFTNGDTPNYSDRNYLLEQLENGNADFVGFVPQFTFSKKTGLGETYINYFKEPALLFAMKNLPCLLVLSNDLKKDLKIKDAEKLPQKEYSKWTEEVFNAKQSKGVALALNWYHLLNKISNKEHYNKAHKNAMEAVKHFKSGEKSKLGVDFTKDLEERFSFFGFSPNIVYIKESSPHKQELAVEWAHPFSQPTLCFLNKKLPYMVITNGNIDFNETRLQKNPENLRHDFAIKSSITNVQGITG